MVALVALVTLGAALLLSAPPPRTPAPGTAISADRSPSTSSLGGDASGAQTATSSGAPATATPPAASAATASAIELPDPGGTCSSANLSIRGITSYFDFSSFGTKVVFVTVSLTNTGGPCALALPGAIAVADDSGSSRIVKVTNTDSAKPRAMERGQQVKVVLGNSWDDERVLAGAGLTPRPCADEVPRVATALFPLASGRLELRWETPWESVCLSPSRVTVAFE